MRNLKRALSLALASVMLMGMMVVGTSAASFPDVDSNDNIEAIDVLETVGVMIGNENGEFEPDKNVTRNEMAVILAKLILGSDADKYVGSCPFTDVPTWAQKYVTACYDNKIVAGRIESVYDGSAVVTAQEAAAMVLRMLGYEKLESTGTNWAQPVVAKANELRLFADVGSSASAPLNRNQVAQLSLNALQTTMVTSDVEQDIIVEGVVTIPGKVTYTERTTNKFDYTQSNGTYVKDTSDEKLQLCENLYEKDLCLVSDGEKDAFGRPSSTWTYNDKDIYSVAETADKTYIGGVKTKDIYKDLGLSSNIPVGGVTVKLDGEDGTENNAARAIDDTNTTKFGADGQVVYVYYTKAAAGGDPAKADIVIISTYLGVVVDEEFTEDDKDGMRVEVFGVGTKFFEATGYKEGDLLLVTVSDTDIQEIIGEPETVTGEVTRVGSDDALTLDGDKYARSIKFDGDADGDSIKGVSTFNVENSYTLYLDRNGCYLAGELDEDNATTDLVYVYDVKGKLAVSNGTGDYKPVATVVKMDGTFKDVPLGDEEYNGVAASDASAAYTGANALKNTLAELKYDEDDKVYTLAEAGDYTSNDITADVELKSDSRYAKFTGSTTYLDDKTVYVFVEENDGGTKVNDVQVVTGGVDFDVDADKMANSVFAVESGKTTAKYVVIMAPYEAANKDIVYIKDSEVKGKVKGGYTFEGYYGTDSKKVEIPVYSVGGRVVESNGTNGPAAKTFYTYTEKADGTLKLSAAGANAKMDKTIESMSNNLLSVNGEDPFKTDKAVTVDLTGKADEEENAYGANVTTLSALRRVVNMTSTEYTVTVDIYVNGDKEVVALFVRSILEDDGIVNKGTKAKMTAALDFSGTSSQAAPDWKENDTVKFTSTGGTVDLDLTFKYGVTRSNGWAKSEGTVPEGWTADFNGTTLTLEKAEASTLDANPFGTVTTVVTANGAAVSNVTVGEPSWTPGVAGDSNTPDPEPDPDPDTPIITDKTPSADKTVSATVEELATKTLTVVAESGDYKTIAYAWKLDGTIDGKNASSIKLSDAGITEAGAYVVTCDLTSETVTTAVTVTFNVTVTDGDVSDALYTVTFDTNGGSGNGPDAIKQTAANTKITLPAIGSVTKAGYTFAGWGTKADSATADAGEANAEYAPSADVALYAVWAANTVGGTVTAADKDSYSVSGNEATFTGKKGGETITVTIAKSSSGNFANEVISVTGIEGATVTTPVGGDAGTGTSVEVTITLPAQASIGTEMASGQTLDITVTAKNS